MYTFHYIVLFSDVVKKLLPPQGYNGDLLDFRRHRRSYRGLLGIRSIRTPPLYVYDRFVCTHDRGGGDDVSSSRRVPP